MVDMTQALNATLSIREKVQEQIKWIDGILEAQDAIVQVNQPGIKIVANHLTLIKVLLEAQDEIIAMAMNNVALSQDINEKLRRLIKE